MSNSSLFLLLSLLMQYSSVIEATFTIAAADTNTSQVGGAGSTCIEVDGISILEAVYVSVPGKAVLHAQAYVVNTPVKLLAKEMMSNGTLPVDILEAITSPKVDMAVIQINADTFFPGHSMRQYGLVDVSGNVAGYTGANIESAYEMFGFPPSAQTDEQGKVDNYVFSAQGNVVSEGTVPMLVSTFQQVKNSNETCNDLAQRLMDSVAAVHSAGLGDVRCENGVGSIAFLHVDAADGENIVSIDIPYKESIKDPIEALKLAFEEWRESNPCDNKNNTGATSGVFSPSITGDNKNNTGATSGVFSPSITGLPFLVCTIFTFSYLSLFTYE